MVYHILDVKRGSEGALSLEYGLELVPKPPQSCTSATCISCKKKKKKKDTWNEKLGLDVILNSISEHPFHFYYYHNHCTYIHSILLKSSDLPSL